MEESKFNSSKPYFDVLQDYIQGGSKDALLSDEQKYLDVLHLLNSLRRKYGKENAIAFIQRPPNNIPYRKAREMYDEAINLFYADDGIEKQAHRNVMFEGLMAAANLILKTSESSKDVEVYGDLITKAYKIKGLDTVDPPRIPEGMYKKPLKIYSLNPGSIGLPMADRKALAERIDNLEISELEKNRIRQEAEVDKIDFLDLFDEQETKVGSHQR
jgi:hypothetical protein